MSRSYGKTCRGCRAKLTSFVALTKIAHRPEIGHLDCANVGGRFARKQRAVSRDSVQGNWGGRWSSCAWLRSDVQLEGSRGRNICSEMPRTFRLLPREAVVNSEIRVTLCGRLGGPIRRCGRIDARMDKTRETESPFLFRGASVRSG